MQTTFQRQAKKKLIATIVSLVTIAAIVTYADHLKAQANTVAFTPSNSDQPIPAPTTAPTNTSLYKDGTYTASSDYYVPRSNENIKVSLTLSNGIVTAASIQNSEGDPTSASFQASFAATYKSYVVGKKISGLQLDYIGGASDTTQGFNNALDQISSQSKA